jgi:hypothetical protein
MGVERYKNPVEYSFQVWVRSIRENYEPVGEDYFLQFVKNVCYFNAKNWKKGSFLEDKILKELPDISRSILEQKLNLFHSCVEFYSVNPYPRGRAFTKEDVPSGYCLEKSFKQGEFKAEIKKVVRDM